MQGNSKFMLVLLGFCGFIFLSPFIFLYERNCFFEKKIQEIKNQSYSYETYVTVADKHMNLHHVIVSTVPISQISYVLTVSMDDTSGETAELNVSSSVYDSTNIGDSILVTIYKSKEDNTITDVRID